MNQTIRLDESQVKQPPAAQPAVQKPAVPPAAPPAVAPVAPPAAPAVRPTVPASRLALRHKLILLSFLLVVVLPGVVSAWYLWTRAEDQYVSTIAFSVRKEESTPSLDLLGGISQLAGTSNTSDTDILYDFLRSEDIVARIDAQIDLRSRFSRAWPQDPVFALDPSEPIEDLTRYWRRQVDVLYDTSTRLITLRVAAFTREDAYEIAQATFDESSRTINRLSDIAREDATRFARTELAKAQERLTQARQAMMAFRMRTQIIDPMADLAGHMGVLNSLQAQLAETLVAQDTLRENARPDDQRIIQADQKIAAIRNRIADERARFGASGEGPGGESYAELMNEYERVAADLEFGETAFRSVQAAYDMALAEAQRQSRYLAAHIEAKPAEASVAPQRMWILGSVLGIMGLIWSVMLLIYYSIRDRR